MIPFRRYSVYISFFLIAASARLKRTSKAHVREIKPRYYFQRYYNIFFSINANIFPLKLKKVREIFPD
ncbi:MAG: hypothetical protein DBY09_06755 [Selenomonadales bacterium]|nr:MAG: hypothetical protein DBY09_06755 [Selenomonadales bacterium]